MHYLVCELIGDPNHLALVESETNKGFLISKDTKEGLTGDLFLNWKGENFVIHFSRKLVLNTRKLSDPYASITHTELMKLKSAVVSSDEEYLNKIVLLCHRLKKEE